PERAGNVIDWNEERAPRAPAHALVRRSDSSDVDPKKSAAHGKITMRNLLTRFPGFRKWNQSNSRILISANGNNVDLDIRPAAGDSRSWNESARKNLRTTPVCTISDA